MAFIEQVNSKANVKQFTTNDLPFSPSQPVINSYYATSTAGQTVITNLGFTVNTLSSGYTDSFFLFVDGKKLTLGTSSTNDYYFTNVAADGTSSQVTLNQSLTVGLNIQAYKLGLKPEIQFGMDNRFTQLYANQQAGFQGFISQTDFLLTATSSAGTPPAGQFYSSIIGRAPIADLSQDLKPRMGIERLMTQSAYQLQNEVGPNGEQVWANGNDLFGQIRFVGGWTPKIDTQGAYLTASTATTDFLEITFYGTGLNLLFYADGNVRPYNYGVDGGTPTAGTTPPSSNGIITNRNYASNSVVNVITGLALGVHTVKVISTSGSLPLELFGFEILNESGNIKVNSGVGYASGQKYITGSQSSFAYSAPVTGTTGGRVLVYQNASGSIGTAFTACAASPSYLGSASHTNEEVSRVYNFREFGAARTDDFSILTVATQAQASFTLDDGSTALTGTHVQTLTSGSTPSDGVCCFTSGTNGVLQVTFIGTGLDIKISTDTSSRSFTSITVDNNSSIGTVSLAANANPQIVKIASGLPYGTHVVTFGNTSATSTPVINQFIVYQPKTPSLPSGAIQVGSYNVLANYVVGSFANSNVASTGTLRKYSVREVVISGTWALTQDTTFFAGGWNLNSTSAGAYIEYEFFGTGIEYGFKTNSGAGGALNTTISIDGSSNLTGFTTSYSPASTGTTFTASTGTISGTSGGQGNSGLSISNMPLAMHKIRVTQNGTGTSGNLDFFGVITPIYSTKSNLYADIQNTLPVGSNAISDDRQTQPIKSVLPSQKAWATAIGNLGQSISSTVYVPVLDMFCTVKTSGGPLQVIATVNVNTSSGAGDGIIYVDGAPVGEYNYVNNGGGSIPLTVIAMVPVSAGNHTVALYMRAESGSITLNSATRSLIVKEG